MQKNQVLTITMGLIYQAFSKIVLKVISKKLQQCSSATVASHLQKTNADFLLLYTGGHLFYPN